MTTTVLVVEDERKLRDLIRDILERERFAVVSTGSGAEAIDLVRRVGPDLVILDLGLPDVSGQDVARDVRRHSTTPIIMLTARIAAEDRINGLELGADDYVTKPFSPRELVLRVRAVLRRSLTGEPEPAIATFGAGEIVIDDVCHVVRVRGAEIDLTPTEWGILTTLATTPRRVYSRYELINRVRGYEFEGYERTIDTHVKNLRHKIEVRPGEPTAIETVVGVGYRFTLARDG